ncbi:uncharacterized protein LACBIDRAFT_335699 [Laccaria bicolor S238N-H82]|uniref:Predicted protein n=1 Tax=Laccaria bicolor (strain S238N-H82 / ATCC MYA-4686) TaxID=486041 RepID=B0E347_LACBS|nr:uncharacterized protein LACBIDRAFT_335699 [Laccaria bicolor S238N-H82]EDQ98734.1 predicted protein [Laccaria bicolor S238N-H82]|eukprot:XP_001890611.1 predicted protein [Laccaria bicolor S238N-H82]
MTLFVGNANQEVRTQLTVSTAVPRNSGYSPIRCFEHVEPSSIIRGTTLAAKSPAFKGSGMKFGSAKKTKQAELLDAALGGEVLATTGLGVEERTEPTKPTQALSNQVHARVSPISALLSVIRLLSSTILSYVSSHSSPGILLLPCFTTTAFSFPPTQGDNMEFVEPK